MEIKHVKSQQDFQKFFDTHKKSYKKNNWEVKMEKYIADRFWIEVKKNEKGIVIEDAENVQNYIEEGIATVELIPYIPGGFSVVNDIEGFTFDNEVEIKTVHPTEIMEVDRLTLVEEYRMNRKPLNMLLTLLLDYSLENNIKYYIMLLEPRFYKMLEKMYKLPIRRVGDEDVYYKEDEQAYTPAIIDCVACHQQINKWYNKEQKVKVSI